MEQVPRKVFLTLSIRHFVRFYTIYVNIYINWIIVTIITFSKLNILVNQASYYICTLEEILHNINNFYKIILFMFNLLKTTMTTHDFNLDLLRRSLTQLFNENHQLTEAHIYIDVFHEKLVLLTILSSNKDQEILTIRCKMLNSCLSLNIITASKPSERMLLGKLKSQPIKKLYADSEPMMIH